MIVCESIEYVETQLIKEMVKQRIQVVGSKILIMGLW